MDASNKYICAKCSNERSFLHLTHVAVYHSHEPHFSYTCNIDCGNCCKTVRSISSLKLHIYREHRNHLLLSEHKNILRCSFVIKIQPKIVNSYIVTAQIFTSNLMDHLRNLTHRLTHRSHCCRLTKQNIQLQKGHATL